ncbi:unnamed protein product [Gongylonema pulchrum]|uniref:BTB domain-containing protein n=1 Tax=Gongylonema pulchrum TaxID=637853 RepID=A0A183DR48_9BILA|nr:unnamed protein product [Gongylonema pulchrum]
MAVVFDPNETGGSDAAELAMVMQKPESSEEIYKLPYMDLTVSSSALEFLLYARMIDAYKIELRMETFHKTNKTVLLRSLQNNSRQTPQLGLFMASVVNDYLVMEPSVVDAVITKLALDRKYEMLVDLLKYCAMHTNLSFIRGIELKWSHAARWLFSLIAIKNIVIF